jgi:cytochrome oxidase Cu insertion factor (SCO1/SenC/PrrC family)
MEPVTPDPKKLRRTAWILVAIMIVGGILILKAYEKRTQEGESDNRPSFVTQIAVQKDLTFIRQDGELEDLMSLKGKVLVVQSLPQSQPDAMTTGVMKRLSKRFANSDDFALVTLMLDPGKPEELQDELEKLAAELGATLPQWTVATNDRPTLHKFIKNEFKANMLPHEEEAEWLYDGSLVLIDRNRHVRRAVIPQKRGGAAYVAAFDFGQAKGWDEEGIKTGTGKTNRQELEVLLGKTIESLLTEKTDDSGQKGGATVLYVGLGFAFLFLLLLIKSRISRKQARL